MRQLSQRLGDLERALPTVGPADLAAYVRTDERGAVRQGRVAPPIELPASLSGLELLGYSEQPAPGGWLAPAPKRRSVPVLDVGAVYRGVDVRPMYPAGALLFDACLVTWAEFERFCICTDQRLPERWPGRDSEDTPCAFVSLPQAVAYARWAGKRLPSEAEWEAAVQLLGAERLQVGARWEWTATPHQRGWVVRGGRWRDRPAEAPRPQNRSFESDAAADVGFRCVTERPERL